MKILSWNVNGLRACGGNGLPEWVERERPDILCVQEIRAHPDQLPDALARLPGYRAYFHPAQRKGYSGVATYVRRRPRTVCEGLGVGAIDREGRVLITEHPGFTLVNAYFPHAQHDHSRLGYKLRFCRALRRRLDAIRAAGRHVVVCGDFNIAHTEIDLARPKDNRRNAGFLPQERRWMDRLLRAGYVDCFRHRCAEPGHYTWWSQRGDVRERNIGWRIDYVVVSDGLLRRLARAFHQPGVRGSDHCPIGVELR